MGTGPADPDYRDGVHLTDADVRNFADLYERRTGIKLDPIKARELAAKLLLFVRALTASPLTRTNTGEPMSEPEQHQ
jgi:hypothetical protein